MIMDSNLVPVDWFVDRGTLALLKRNAETLGMPTFVMPYFDTDNGAYVYGLIGTGFGDGRYWGLKPSAKFNPQIMAMLKEWQGDGLRILRNREGMNQQEICHIMAEQIFISSGLAIAGRSLLQCNADVPTTNFIRNGLTELRTRIYAGRPPSGEIELLSVLLENADCPRVNRGGGQKAQAA